MQQPLMFKLDQHPNGRGLRCDGDGLFLGRNALLRRNERGNFEARPADQLQKTFARAYRNEADWDSRIRSVKLVATALNNGEMARAMMTAVLMRLPEPDSPDRTGDADGPLEKAGFNPEEPRDERGRWSLWAEAKSLLSEIAQAQAEADAANRATTAAEMHGVAEAYDAYSRFMEQPIGGSMPITPESPIWGYGDNVQLAPMRPITAGDAIGAAGSVLSLLPFGRASEAAEIPELLGSESEAFIIRPLDLPPNFNSTLPVGRYVIPKNAVPGTTTYGNLVGKQIGDLFRDAFPDVRMILRTEPGMKGVDIEILDRHANYVGFRYWEIKPLTNYGVSSLRSQIASWKLPAPVQAISYDYEGNIYYGFPR